MRCPRCQSETGHAAIRCADCGAPLALPDEPAARPLDRSLDLDRRGPRATLPERWPASPLTPASAEDLTPAPGDPLLALPPPGAVVEVTRASSARRAAAWLIDGLPFALGTAWLVQALGATEPRLLAQLVVLAALASFTYQTLLHWLLGATVGKLLLRLRVVGPDGERPGPGRSALRALFAVVGVLALGLGPLTALFTRSGQGLHDLLARTVVVDAP